MNRPARRRIERELRKILERGADHCTLCSRPFAHSDLTYGGGTADNRAVVTGECCHPRRRRRSALPRATCRERRRPPLAPT
jgi:hypothetical protein